MRIRAVLAAVAMVIATLALPTSNASSAPVFTEFAAHPSIAAQPESGRSIKDLAVKGGKLYAGYGDYSGNTGPIDIATVDLETGVTGVEGTAGTEEINTYRSYGGALYAPWIDTKGVSGFYSSDQGGTWASADTVDTEHVFDVAVLPNGVQVAVGSSNNDARTAYQGATAWVSYDGGRTWRIEMTDLTNAKHPTETGYERYYWVAVIGGKAYMQARAVNAVYGQPDFPIRVFDGSRWSTVSKSADCFSTEASGVEVFNGKVYCDNGTVFSGKRATSSGGQRATDFFQHAGVLYALDYDGFIRQLGPGGWVDVTRIDATDRPRSLAVTDSSFYVGDGYGRIYRASR